MSQKPTVLIVDDEPMTRDLLEGFLFREGYHLIFASNGGEVLDNLDELSPDVILLDIMMPDVNGFEVCQYLKTNKKWRHIPIILVTALGSTEDLLRGFEAGADDFLPKPVNDLELRARVRSMLRIKKQYDDLQASLRLREDLARMLVHDIRNPLAVITTYSAVLEANKNASIGILLDGFSKIKSQALRLEGYLNDMLLLAKMEAGQFILHHATQDLNSFIKSVIENYTIVAESNGITLTADLPAISRRISFDRNLFQRVLDNLISNALKFSPPKSTVTVQVEYPDQEANIQCRLKVIDEGPGIPEEHRDRIFDKFEIVSLKRKSVSQVGLGLAFCKMVVEAHDGRIFAESNQPVGTTFVIEI